MINKPFALLVSIFFPLFGLAQTVSSPAKKTTAKPWVNNGAFILSLDSIKTNQEVKVVSFTIPAGGIDTNGHVHQAYLVGYVLDGNIETKMKDRPAQTLKAGDFFYEYPNEVHESIKNQSSDKAATILLYYLYNKGAVLYTPVHHGQ